jgi:hypothetical protein
LFIITTKEVKTVKKAFIFLAVAAAFLLPAGKAEIRPEYIEAIEIPVIVAPSLSSPPAS